jgi:hypothetical protein
MHGALKPETAFHHWQRVEGELGIECTFDPSNRVNNEDPRGAILVEKGVELIRRSEGKPIRITNSTLQRILSKHEARIVWICREAPLTRESLRRNVDTDLSVAKEDWPGIGTNRRKENQRVEIPLDRRFSKLLKKGARDQGNGEKRVGGKAVAMKVFRTLMRAVNLIGAIVG